MRKMDSRYLATVGLTVSVWICSLMGNMDLRMELSLLCYTCQSVDTIGAKA